MFINPFKASLSNVFESWVDYIAPGTTIFNGMSSMSEWSYPIASRRWLVRSEEHRVVS